MAAVEQVRLTVASGALRVLLLHLILMEWLPGMIDRRTVLPEALPLAPAVLSLAPAVLFLAPAVLPLVLHLVPVVLPLAQVVVPPAPVELLLALVVVLLPAHVVVLELLPHLLPSPLLPSPLLPSPPMLVSLLLAVAVEAAVEEELGSLTEE